MYVCICAAVSDRQIASAIATGADTLEKLGAELGVGMGCGRCRETARAMIDAHAAGGMVRIAPPGRPLDNGAHPPLKARECSRTAPSSRT